LNHSNERRHHELSCTDAAAEPNRPHSVEFFRLPQPGKLDPFFGLSRGWYYKAHAAGEISMVAVRLRGALRGVRLVAYDSVCAYIRRAARATVPASAGDISAPEHAVRPEQHGFRSDERC
jgi:hypothetical protein